MDSPAKQLAEPFLPLQTYPLSFIVCPDGHVGQAPPLEEICISWQLTRLFPNLIVLSTISGLARERLANRAATRKHVFMVMDDIVVPCFIVRSMV